MEEFPIGLRADIPAAELAAVLGWWGQLPATARRELVSAYDERWEECFFGPTPDGEEVPAIEGGRFVPSDAASWPGEWGDWREYLTEHPDSFLLAMFPVYWGWWRAWFEVTDLPPSQQPQWEARLLPPGSG